MASKITSGECVVYLGGDEIVLRPTLRATTQISRTYGGMAKARQALVDENIDAIAHILRLGGGMGDREAKDLTEKVWKNGITVELLVPLIRFVGILGNGGKPLDDDQSADDSGAEEHHQGNS